MTLTTSQPTLNNVANTIQQYSSLIETVAKVEYQRLASSSYLVDYSELVNIGAVAVHVLLNNHKDSTLNSSYISTAIKWAIRNELRRRYKWYSLKTKSQQSELNELLEHSEDIAEVSKSQVREAVYGTILSIDELSEGENPIQVKDSSYTPAESFELRELNQAIRDAIEKLPPREKLALEERFFNNKKIRELAEDFNVTPSRITRIIQAGLNRVKKQLQEKDFA